jgi:hypothetical protein
MTSKQGSEDTGDMQVQRITVVLNGIATLIDYGLH